VYFAFEVKNVEKICSIFGGHLKSINFPLKNGRILCLLLNSGRVLTPISRHIFYHTMEEVKTIHWKMLSTPN